jgi:CRP-like cAMP-binding protein
MSFGACEPHLVSYYAQFKMRPYAMRQFFSEESGYIVPLVTLHHGEEPFGEDPPECIRRIVRGESAVRNGDAIGQGAYARELADALAPMRGERSLFRDVADDEVERCCVHSSLITCAADDQILRTGGTARNPFMVVSGRLEARRDRRVIQELGPGDLFGESGWFGDHDREADVFVIENGSRILALSLGTLRKLRDTDPALALTLTTNAVSILWSRLRDGRNLTG